jgi:hypothetical protein
LALLVFAVLSLRSAAGQAAARDGFVGDAACAGCHEAKTASYLHTAHHLTSHNPSPASVLGSFKPGHDQLVIVPESNTAGLPPLRFLMERKGDKFIETVVSGDGVDAVTQTETIGVVTGSGTRGQTYLYWRRDSLFELPVSYWTDGKRWINSPGYQNGTADFSRPVTAGCMECHSTYLQAVSGNAGGNRFRKDTLEVGISCERCHGPGAAHVARYRGGAPAAADEIVNPAKFSRERQLELCAYCHSGIQREAVAPAFSYVAGQPLANYFKPIGGGVAEHPDVHGNQVGLLERSRCFRESAAMTCSNCHNTHEAEQPAASYSAKCLSCHQWQACKVAKTIGLRAKGNCIDCHMPVEKTNVIVTQTAGEELHAAMRNHWIKVYPEARLP